MMAEKDHAPEIPSFKVMVNIHQKLLRSMIPFLRQTEGHEQFLNHCHSLLITLGPIVNDEEYAAESIGRAVARDIFRNQAAAVIRIQDALKNEMDRIGAHRKLAQDPEGAQAVADSLDGGAIRSKTSVIAFPLPLQLTHGNLQLLDELFDPSPFKGAPQVMLQAAPNSYQVLARGSTWSSVWAYSRLLPAEEDKTTSRISCASETKPDADTVHPSCLIAKQAPEYQPTVYLHRQQTTYQNADGQQERDNEEPYHNVSSCVSDVPLRSDYSSPRELTLESPTTPGMQITPLLPPRPSAPRKHKIEKRYIPRRDVSHWIRRVAKAKKDGRQPLEELEVVANH